ncbi:hypothetical protein K439DRAFT_584978 [Ramaria rubella]|nr:hypothetical protein K439DRAFT_584978 [Ramaria rubella]
MNSSRIVLPPSPSEPDSDFDSRPAQAARASIKDLFQNALREPGDTPQKPALTRRASFNAIESPKVNKSRREITSDEEREISSAHRADRRFDLSAAASLDRLRLQLSESLPSVQGVSTVASSSHPPSEGPSTPQRATSSYPRPSKIKGPSPVTSTKSHKDLEPFRIANGSQDDDSQSSRRTKLQYNQIPRAQTSMPEHPPSRPSMTSYSSLGTSSKSYSLDSAHPNESTPLEAPISQDGPIEHECKPFYHFFLRRTKSSSQLNVQAHYLSYRSRASARASASSRP